MNDKLGLAPGLVVQELGWDSDVDDDVRVMIEDADRRRARSRTPWRPSTSCCCGGGTTTAISSTAWWTALTDLTDAGYIWLMTPKVGRTGYVDAADLAEAAVTAGLAQTNSAAVSADWAATKLVRPKGTRR